MVWMRTSAFSSFRKLYGRILIEENTRLAFKINQDTNASFLSSFLKLNPQEKINLNRSKYLNKKLAQMESNGDFVRSSVVKYRLPKGLYYVDIQYSMHLIPK